MSQVQFIGVSVADLAIQLQELILPQLRSQITAELQPKEQLEFLTRKDACDLLKINLATLWRWQKKGILKAYSIENRVLFERKEVYEVINKNLLK